MKLICPSCGAVASLEAWINDDDAKELIEIVAEMDRDLGRTIIRYLGLFRAPGGRGLTWHRALKLVKELQELIFAEKIVWNKQRPLQNYPFFWLQAMESILERDNQGKITRPLKNHNLLRVIAYDVAAKYECKVYESKIHERRNKNRETVVEEEFDIEKTKQHLENIKKLLRCRK